MWYKFKLTARARVSVIYFQYSWKLYGFPAELIRFHFPLVLVYPLKLFCNYINHASQQVVKHVKNIYHFLIIITTCLTSEKITKFWCHKFDKTLNKMLEIN